MYSSVLHDTQAAAASRHVGHLTLLFHFSITTCLIYAGGEAAGAAGAAPSAAGLDQPPPAWFGGEDAGFSSGMNTQQQPGFGDEAESFRWDTGSSSSSSEAGGGDGGGWGFGGGEGGGGDEEGASGLWGLVVGLWAMIFGE